TARGQGTSAPGGSAQGGGIYQAVATTMTNVTVSGNSLDVAGGSSGAGGSTSGGGIYVNDTLTALNSTIADNSIRAPGTPVGSARGGNLAIGGLPTHFKNTIVSGGHADTGFENCREVLGTDGHN